MPPPLVLAGQVRSAGQSLVNAQVRAYGIVPSLEHGRERAVFLASAITDTAGHYLLTLPYLLNEPASTGDAGAGDAGAGDAGQGSR
jgi:hypothetical protein